jgi:hypothetical protein
MITLRLPKDHPNSPVVQKWAADKEQIITGHGDRLQHLENVLKTILTNNPQLGKAK